MQSNPEEGKMNHCPTCTCDPDHDDECEGTMCWCETRKKRIEEFDKIFEEAFDKRVEIYAKREKNGQCGSCGCKYHPDEIGVPKIPEFKK